MADRYDQFGRPRPAIAGAKLDDGSPLIIIGIPEKGLDQLKDFERNSYQIQLAPFGVHVLLLISGCKDYDAFVRQLKKSPQFRDIGTSGQPDDIADSWPVLARDALALLERAAAPVDALEALQLRLKKLEE